MTITIAIILWLACGFISAWYRHTVLDRSKRDTKGSTVMWMTFGGLITFVLVAFFTPFELIDRHKDTVVFKSKSK